MALQVTRWSPDTCGCILEYEWNDTQPADTRVHSFKNAIHLCEYHLPFAIMKEKPLLGQGAYDEVISENTRKNVVFADVQILFPSLMPENYNWSFDTQRKLKVGFLGISIISAQKKSLQDAFDAKFGKNKVEVI